jgi:WD40 repeat protein
LWDIAHLRLFEEWQGVDDTPVAFSSDGATLALIDSDYVVHLWDIATGQEQGQIATHLSDGGLVGFSGDRLVTAGRDGIQVWDTQSGEVVGGPLGLDRYVIDMTFNADGSWLAANVIDSARQYYLVDVWQMSSQQLIFQLINRPKIETIGADYQPRHLTFSADGSRIAATSGDQIIVWDALTGERQLVFRFGGIRRGPITAYDVAFSPDGRLLAVGDSEGVIRLWDANTGTRLAVLDNHSFSVNDVEFTSDGTLLISSSSDGSIRLWGIP